VARHFLEVNDVATIPTRDFQLTQRAVRDIVSRQAMGAVTGDAGLGKTLSVEFATNKLQNIQVVWVQFPRKVSMKDGVAGLLDEITGIPNEDTLRRLGLRLREVLRAERRLIVVDEAQHLNTDTIEYIRYLWDDPDTQFAVLFVGGDDCWDVLSREPMLRSRIWRHVEFKRLPQAVVLNFVPKYHAIYERASTKNILLINDRFAHGNFRMWAQFTIDAAALCTELRRDTVDEEIIRNVFALHASAA